MEAKAPPSPRSRVREGQVQQRMEPHWDTQLLDFDSYAAHFALSHEGQAEVARRVREDLDRNAARKREIEAKKAADERDCVE